MEKKKKSSCISWLCEPMVIEYGGCFCLIRVGAVFLLCMCAAHSAYSRACICWWTQQCIPTTSDISNYQGWKSSQVKWDIEIVCGKQQKQHWNKTNWKKTLIFKVYCITTLRIWFFIRWNIWTVHGRYIRLKWVPW